MRILRIVVSLLEWVTIASIAVLVIAGGWTLVYVIGSLVRDWITGG